MIRRPIWLLFLVASCAAPQQNTELMRAITELRQEQNADRESLRQQVSELKAALGELKAEQQALHDRMGEAQPAAVRNSPDESAVYSVPVGDSPVRGSDTAWSQCVEQSVPAKSISADQALAAALGASGVPAFYINGRTLMGAQPAVQFEALIDAELAKAKESALSAADYYRQRVVEQGRKSM